jgi:hypothetical protein
MMLIMVKFQDLQHFTSDDIDAAMNRNDPEELYLVPVIVALAFADRSRAEAVCVELCSHEDRRVRGNAVTSLGHLARRFRSLDQKTVQPLIEQALDDADLQVRMNAKSAADEIHQFLHWQIAGHVYG